MLNAHTRDNAVPQQNNMLRAPKPKEKQINLKQMHKCVPLLPLQNTNKNTSSVKSAHSSGEHLHRSVLPQKAAASPWQHFGSNLPWYPCAPPHGTTLLKYCLQPSWSSLKASQPVALNTVHTSSGLCVSPNTAQNRAPEAWHKQTHGARLQPLSRETSWLRDLLQCEATKVQTLQNEGYLQHK